jgi:hypothetical protein
MNGLDGRPLPAGEADAFPSVGEIDRILALSDLTLRNLFITQSYHELSERLSGMLGPAANWCTFAVWASKQAGQTIRREDLKRTLEQKIGEAGGLAHCLHEVAAAAHGFGSRTDSAEVHRAVKSALLASPTLDRASDAVSRGNRKVFEEIAREFSRFLATFAGDTAYDAEKIARFVEALRPGDPPDGQEYLRRAFRHLYQARFDVDPKVRAERILLVNLEVGFHEQTRLQPEIEDALEAPLPEREELRQKLLHALFPKAGFILRMRLRLPRLLRRMSHLDRALERLCEELRLVVRRAVTEVLMRQEVPGEEPMRLGRDLRRSFPESLRTLADPDLVALLKRIDPTADSPARSGAEDWADLAERMHFVADYFRCSQEHAPLLQPPFSPDQVAALKSGRLPSGRL